MIRKPTSVRFKTRAERFHVREGVTIEIEVQLEGGAVASGRAIEVSRSGAQCVVTEGAGGLEVGARVDRLDFHVELVELEIRGAVVRRLEPINVGGLPTGLVVASFAFDEAAELLPAELKPFLAHSAYVTGELLTRTATDGFPQVNALEHTLFDFYRKDSRDLFEKCNAFYEMVKDMQRRKMYQCLYRVTVTSGLDHRISVFNPIRRTEEQFLCFDSNSYLGLHRHPRVVEAVHAALDKVGYGTPSAQVLSGTNRYLRELEDALSRFHGRQDTMIFPSGYAANLGAITALVRANDLVVRDRFSHASIHDAVRASGSRFQRVVAHDDMEALDVALTKGAANESVKGKLVATDGVFSMHGLRANLPALVAIARHHGAKLLVDEAHATGVLGKTGRGLEEHYGMPGTIDVLVGTFSKVPGTTGGYVCGSRKMIEYLRFYANPGMFTASLPAAQCAGVLEAYRLIDEEPQHRERLWRNTEVLAEGLRSAGFLLPEEIQSPILTVLLGSSALMFVFSRDLFMHGIKCGSVAYPAVPVGEAILRIAVNARHTDDDLERAVEIFTQLGARYGVLGKPREELLAIGDRIAADLADEGRPA